MIKIFDNTLASYLMEHYPEYLNSKKNGELFFEITSREKGKFKTMTKVIGNFTNSSSLDQSQTVESMMKQFFGQSNQKLNTIMANQQALTSMTGNLVSMGAQLTTTIALGWVNVGLNAANIVTTVACTAVISKKINGIRKQLDEISVKMDQVYQKVSQISDLQQITTIKERYQKILSDTNTIVVNFSQGKEVQQKELVDLLKEYRLYLCSMIDFAERYPSEEVLEIIHSLLPQFADLIVMYYELFYDEYGANLNPSHAEWMEVFELVRDEKFTQMLYDYHMIDKEIHHKYINQVTAMNSMMSIACETRVQDTMELFAITGSVKAYQELTATMDEILLENVKEEIIEEYNGEVTAEMFDEAASMLRKHTAA